MLNLLDKLRVCFVTGISWVFIQFVTIDNAHSEDFDFWMLSLSWSPTYCNEADKNAKQRQCQIGRNYAFVVHGLWPQYQRGWPSYCIKPAPFVAEDIVQNMLDIMPSRGLVIHQWRKHGTCSGLSDKMYFEATRTLLNQVNIPQKYIEPNQLIVTSPEELAQDFIKANQGLHRSDLTIDCGNARERARLDEIRICFDKSFKFRDCGNASSRQCKAKKLTLLPVR